MSNQTLLDIFLLWTAANKSMSKQELLLMLKEHSLKDGGREDLESVLEVAIKDAQSNLNLTLKTDTCGFCDGDFREVMMAYNRIHGYVSLVVSAFGFRFGFRTRSWVWSFMKWSLVFQINRL